MLKQNFKNRFIAILCSTMLITSSFSSVQAYEKKVQPIQNTSDKNINEKMILWYNKPADVNDAGGSGGKWMQESLPLGNGDLGNLIFGGVSKERIHFNEKSLWSGGPSAS